uniref:SNARE-interacting protein KEULE n=2 Tax=Salix viminalis TaxID=40686 RepID=A0A6N2L699_SALVM
MDGGLSLCSLFFYVPMLLILSRFDLCNAGGVLITGFILQCYHVLVRHVWEISFIQKVCEKFYLLPHTSLTFWKFKLTNVSQLIFFSCLHMKGICFLQFPYFKRTGFSYQERFKCINSYRCIERDSQGFITGNERALEELFVDEEDTRKGHACLNVMASRIATVFASLREFPFVRYRAAKSLDVTTMTTFRDLIPTKLAARVWDCLIQYKQKTEHFPQTETCELLILDRSIDQIAPIIHEWTYDAMCHDHLNMEGNKYVHEVLSKAGGPPEKKDVLLEGHDPVWLELRHAHIADRWWGTFYKGPATDGSSIASIQ